MQDWLSGLKVWAQALKRDAIALYLAGRDPRVSWWVKALAATIAAYALSPIDLIPDFVPVLGYLDELILLPLAIAVVVRVIDPLILAEHRAAAVQIVGRPVSKAGAALVILLWVISLALVAWWLWR